MKKRTILSVLATAVIALSLTGCTGGKGFTVSTLEQTAAGVDQSYVLEDKTSIVVTLSGSSSCPPTVKKASFKDGRVTLTVADYEGKPCTADYALSAYRIKANAGDFDFNKVAVTVCSGTNCSDLLVEEKSTT